MGLPWPPLWEPGAHCNTCEVPLFSGSTPLFVYAFAQGIGKCPGVPPEVPDPNRVVRMTQLPGFSCIWEGFYAHLTWIYGYILRVAPISSTMAIADVSGMRIFHQTIPAVCQDSFSNSLVCGAPIFPGFSGGIVNCFW